ncbi:MAG: hypothetical protein JWP09_320 [Candidatus Taylorbacteria bacterium]|nr:hypothetical protein [Candidatus Taylorbacteria bacterium]
MDTLQTKPVGAKGGSSLAIIIIILIIALGGAYFWYSRSVTTPAAMNNKDMKAQPSVSKADLQKGLDAAGSVDITGDMKGMDQVYK